VICAIATALAPGCSWMMVKPPDDGARGPRAVCTETTIYEDIDELYAVEIGLAALVSGAMLVLPHPGHDLDGLDEGMFVITAPTAVLLGASARAGTRDTARCRAVHRQLGFAP